jgi:hypothetical protein
MNDVDATGHDELASLLGVYALDALRPDERHAVEAHLETCDACRDEVHRHLEVAAGLSALSIDAPPDDLWDRILASLDEPAGEQPAIRPPALTITGDSADRAMGEAKPDVAAPDASAPSPPPTFAEPISLAARRRSRSRLVLAVASVAAALLVVVLALGWAHANQRAREAESAAAPPSVEQAASAALADPANHQYVLKAADGTPAATAVVAPDGNGFLVPHTLASLPPDRTYQLWHIDAQGPVSIGVMGNQPGVSAFHVQGPINTLALTDERAGGVAAPTSNPLASATA